MEPKLEKMRHSSVSSSLDEGSCGSAFTGLRAAGGECCCVQRQGSCCCSKESSAAGDRSCGRGKLWRSGSKGGGGNRQGSSEVRLLERNGTDSSELDSPSLSGSLPSVADSHCSRLSSELSCSDPDTSRPAHPTCSSSADTQLPSLAAPAAITPLTEVEHDRLEQCPAAPAHRLLSSPPASPKEGRVLFVSEEAGDGVTDAEEKIPNQTTRGWSTAEKPKRKHCIQTDI